MALALSIVCNKISPTEVDGKLAHGGKSNQRQHNPVQIKNKTDWNCFLDKFNREIYPNVILLIDDKQSLLDGLTNSIRHTCGEDVYM